MANNQTLINYPLISASKHRKFTIFRSHLAPISRRFPKPSASFGDFFGARRTLHNPQLEMPFADAWHRSALVYVANVAGCPGCHVADVAASCCRLLFPCWNHWHRFCVWLWMAAATFLGEFHTENMEKWKFCHGTNSDIGATLRCHCIWAKKLIRKCHQWWQVFRQTRLQCSCSIGWWLMDISPGAVVALGKFIDDGALKFGYAISRRVM